MRQRSRRSAPNSSSSNLKAAVCLVVVLALAFFWCGTKSIDSADAPLCADPPPCPEPIVGAARGGNEQANARGGGTPALRADCPRCATCSDCSAEVAAALAAQGAAGGRDGVAGDGAECPPCEACPSTGADGKPCPEVSCPPPVECPDTSGAATAVTPTTFTPGPQFAPTPGSLDYLDSWTGAEPLHIIYHHSAYHWYWHLDHWLAGLKRPIIMTIDTRGDICRRGSIVVVNHLSIKDGKFNPDNYFRRCEAEGITKIGVFHTGDIEFDQSYGYYHKAAFVYRNHYPSRSIMSAKNMPGSKTKLMPLGSKNLETISLDDFRQTLTSDQRKHFCGFIGALAHHTTRKNMADGLQADGWVPSQSTYKKMGFDGGRACAVYFSTSDWGNNKQMSREEYRQVMQQTVFALVPLGRGPDSFRVYEALELGAIPIITDVDAFNIPFGSDHPLPKVAESEWKTKVPQMLEAWWNDREGVFRLQKEVFRWWILWKEQFRQGLAADVDALFQ